MLSRSSDRTSICFGNNKATQILQSNSMTVLHHDHTINFRAICYHHLLTCWPAMNHNPTPPSPATATILEALRLLHCSNRCDILKDRLTKYPFPHLNNYRTT